MRNINLELKIRNLKFQILDILIFFRLNRSQNRRIVKHCSFYIRLKWGQLRSMLFFIALANIRKPKIFDIFRGHKREYWPKIGQTTTISVRTAQFDFVARNASSSIVKQNDSENKTTWLAQTVLSKSFSWNRTNYIEDIKNNFSKDYFFAKNLLYIKKFSSKMLFKFSKNVELKIVNDSKIG